MGLGKQSFMELRAILITDLESFLVVRIITV